MIYSKEEAIVKGATRLAHSMGLEVVAEGVENEISVNILKKIGCDKLQGYFFSKPLNIEDFNNWLQASQWGADKHVGDIEAKLVEEYQKHLDHSS